MSKWFYCPVDGCNERFGNARDLQNHKQFEHNHTLDEFAEGSQ